MAPIPVHTKSPINAAKAEGITPQTAAADENEHLGIAQPGASPNNAPATPANSIQNQLHAPLQPTTTQQITPGGMGTNSPPPPQPGAVPYPPANKTVMPSPPGAPGNTHYASPPPPATTQAAVLPGTGTGSGNGGGITYPALTPPQMGMSLTEPAAPHTYRGTSTAPTTTTAAPGSRQFGHTTAENSGGYPAYPPPGGYQQNLNASGIVSGGGNYQDDDGDEGGVWNSAMKWTQTAGEKLSAAESEIWKRINKE